MKYLTTVIILALVSPVYGHSGRTDSCGGHNDRKRGTYHVHNTAKYNACHPNKSTKKSTNTKKKAKNREFVVMDTANGGKVRYRPFGNKVLADLKPGTKIEIFGKKTLKSGPINVTWYQVKVKGKTGWISEYVTMGKIIKE